MTFLSLVQQVVYIFDFQQVNMVQKFSMDNIVYISTQGGH